MKRNVKTERVSYYFRTAKPLPDFFEHFNSYLITKLFINKKKEGMDEGSVG